VAETGRILIVKLSAMGDVVHALPAVAYLRDRLPSAEIHWAVDARFAELLEGHPGIDTVVPLPIRGWKGRAASATTWREVAAAAARLRRVRYDIAFDVQGNIKSGVVTFLSGAPLRYGFPRGAAREPQNLWFTNRRPPTSPSDRHVSEKILRLVSAPFDGRFSLADFPGRISGTAGECREANRLLAELLPGATPRLAIHPGTTWSTKRMDPSFWADTVRILRDAFPALGTFLSWGTEAERDECVAIREGAKGGVAVLPRLGFKALAAAFRVCGYAMGPDTGPVHLAAAAGAVTVSVFRATDGRRNAPFGPRHRFLQAPFPCTACLRRRCDRDAACRASVRPEDAATAMADRMTAGEVG
jgi:lipopolysaccharide heptosyltransferase I